MAVISVTALAVFLPLGLIFYQSLLNAPFFATGKTVGFGAFAFIFADSDFWDAFRNSLVIAAGMALIAVPLGGILAFLIVRTDLPGRQWIEPLLLIPVFVSPMVLAFGYVVSAGPVGFYSVWARDLFGGVPWNVYSLTAIAIIAGLTHVPHVYLYSSSALKSLGSDVEEAARMTGASPFQVAKDVSLPMVTPSLLFSGVLVFFLGFEIFGLPLVLGDPEGHLVLATYLYKLTNKLGTPSYHLMAAVAVCIVAVTFPLVMLQRYLLKNAGKFVTVKGKAGRQRPLPLGKWRWVAAAILALWLFLTVVVPLSGIALRSVVSSWGEGVVLADVLTLDHFREVFEQPTLVRGILNTVLIGVVGGALAVACYTAIGLATHRQPDGWSRFVDYLVLVPRGAGAAGGSRLSVGVPVLSTARALARDDLQRVARVHGGLARVRHASRVELAAAGRTRTGGGRAQCRCHACPDQPPRDAAAHSLRPARELAAGLHDLRARVFDRCLPARSGDRGHRFAAGVAVVDGRRRHGGRAVAHQRCARGGRAADRAAIRGETP
jgi:iron(III) transport system permease protein